MVHRIGQLVTENDRDHELMRTIQRGIGRLFRLETKFPTIAKMQYSSSSGTTTTTTTTTPTANTTTAATSPSYDENWNNGNNNHNSNNSDDENDEGETLPSSPSLSPLSSSLSSSLVDNGENSSGGGDNIVNMSHGGGNGSGGGGTGENQYHQANYSRGSKFVNRVSSSGSIRLDHNMINFRNSQSNIYSHGQNGGGQNGGSQNGPNGVQNNVGGGEQQHKKYGERIEGLNWDDFVDDTIFHFRDTHSEVKFLCPIVFMKIREKFNVNSTQFERQLGGMAGAFTRMGTPGKSGAFFFYCPSMQYLLKSVNDEECAFLLDMLPNYVRHVSRNPKTLLSNFLSFFEVMTSHGQKYRFVVMNNVFYTNLPMDRRYDLKGSTANRAASEVEKRKKSPILKDKDIEVGSIKLTRESKLELYRRLQHDCKFLRENGIMDYSLLMGVHDVVMNSMSGGGGAADNDTGDENSCHSSDVMSECHNNTMTTSTDQGNGDSGEFESIYQQVIVQNEKRWTGEFNNCVASRDGRNIYFFGIIDILQKFNGRKLIEKVVKTSMQKVKSKIKARDRPEKISVADPSKYARRFESFIKILCSEVSLDSFKLGSQESFMHLDEAEEYYNMAVRANSHDSTALFYRAVLYYSTILDNKWNAMQDLNKSIRLNSTASNILSFLWRGMLFFEQGEYEMAIRDFSRVIEMNPQCPDPYLLRGIVYHKGLKHYPLAERDYSRNLELNPGLGDPYGFSKIMSLFGLTPFNAYVQKGLLYNDMNERPKAIAELKKALDAAPSTKYRIHYELGKLYEQHGDVIDAMLSYGRSIEHNPTFFEAYYARGRLRKSTKRSIEDYTRAIELCPQFAPAYFYRGILYKDEFSEYESALADLNKYMKWEPNDVRALIARGECLSHLRRFNESEASFLRALELAPNQLDIYNHLTNLYATTDSPLRSNERAQYYVDAKLVIMMMEMNR